MADDELAKREGQVDKLRQALDDSARNFRIVDVWLLGIELYAFVAVASVSHDMMFVEAPIGMPVINVQVPLVAFFTFAPILLLVLHLNLFIQAHFLRVKADEFRKDGGGLPGEVFDRQRRLTFPSPLTHLLIGRPDGSGPSLFMTVMAWATSIAFPLGLLMYIQAKFLLYQSEPITWLHRSVVILDLFIVGYFWAMLRAPWWEAIKSAWLWVRRIGRRDIFRDAAANPLSTPYLLQFVGWVLAIPLFLLWPLRILVRPIAGLAAEWALLTFESIFGEPAPERGKRRELALCALPILFWIVFVAETAGGPIEAALGGWFHRERNVAIGALMPRSFTLVGWTLIDENLPDEAVKQWRKALKPAAASGPDAENAESPALPEDAARRERTLDLDFSGRSLRYADFERSRLLGARFQGADLGEAVFNFADLREAIFDQARLQGASLRGAQLQGASLLRAQLQGASLVLAQLQGASLRGAQLQGASLVNAELQGASLVLAQLQGASLRGAQLQGASLVNAELQGASLDEAQLQGASLDEAQLQGASLEGAQLQGASLEGARIARADLGGAYLTLSDVRGVDETTEPDWDAIGRLIRDAVPAGRRQAEALDGIEAARTRGLDLSVASATLALVSEIEGGFPWQHPVLEHQLTNRGAVVANSPEVANHHAQLALFLGDLACDAEHAPHVARRLLQSGRLTATGPHVREIVKQLKGDAGQAPCPGAEGLTEDELAELDMMVQEADVQSEPAETGPSER